MVIQRRVGRPLWTVTLLVVAGVLLAACADGGADQTAGADGGSSSTTPGPTTPGSTGTVGSVGSSTTQPPSSATTTGGGTVTPGPSTTLGGPGLPPVTPPSEPVVTVVGGGSTATGLKAVPGCREARALVTLSWTPAGSAEQVVAVSARPDGLENGNYTTSEALPPTGSTYELRDSQPGGVYYWRVLTRRGGSWAASETGTFEGPTCVAF